MLSHLFRLALRNLRKNPGYSVINLIGLILGLTCLTVIGLWILNELSYDRFEKNGNRIYRLTVEVSNPNGIHSHFARSWQNWISKMPEYFPSVEAMARFSPMKKTAFKYGNIKFNESNVFQANPEVLDVFSINLLSGDPGNALRGPQKVLLSQSIVKNFFNGMDIIGKSIEMAGIWDTTFINYEVSGIFRDFPSNSHFHPAILVSMKDPGKFEGWAYTYLMLHKGDSPDNIIKNFESFAEINLTGEQRTSSRLHLQPLRKIHLYSDKDRELEKNGDIKMVFFFGVIGIIIFGLAMINYINLSLALIFRKKKTLVISKVFGARIRDIFMGFLIESGILFILSSLLTIILLVILQPVFSGFISIDNSLLNLIRITGALCIISLVGSLTASVIQLISIIRPFSFSPVFVPQKMSLVTLVQNHGYGLKKLLVMGQFTASIVLITCALYFTRQRNYLMDHRLGAENDPIVLLGNLNWQVKGDYFEFKNLALQHHAVKSVTGSMQAPSEEIMDALPFSMEGIPADSKMELYVSPVDYNFFRFFNLEILKGHDFSSYSRESLKEEYIINETALHYLGFSDPSEVIGRAFKPQFNMEGIFKGGVIVGVVKDFCFSSMKHPIKPFVFFQKPIWYWNFLVKLDSAHTQEGLRYLRSVWNKVYPQYVFDYSFNNRSYDRIYSTEISQARLSNYFMLIALIIAVLGLYGLASITIAQRIREIGIRKVIGARSGDIVWMLNRDFTIWVGVAVVVAVPIAWYVLSRWSRNYAYHVPLSWWIFVAAGCGALMVSWITVSIRTIRASLKNPVEVLRQD